MRRTRIANASPIIVLAKAGRLDLLDDPAVDLLVPEAVVTELEAGPVDDPARVRIREGWGRRINVPSPPIAVIEWGLGAGESAVIAAALERPGAVALLDDAQARRCARTLGVPVLGTLGLILAARRARRLESAADVFRALRRVGLHFDDALAAAVLRDVCGESWQP